MSLLVEVILYVVLQGTQFLMGGKEVNQTTFVNGNDSPYRNIPKVILVIEWAEEV